MYEDILVKSKKKKKKKKKRNLVMLKSLSVNYQEVCQKKKKKNQPRTN